MTHTAKITDHWLPVPDAVLKEISWQDGDEIQIEITGDTLVLTKIADGGTRAVVREKTKRGRSI